MELKCFSLSASVGRLYVCVHVCTHVRVSSCACFQASPALAATSAAVRLCSFWRMRNVSAGPTTLETQSYPDTSYLEWNSVTPDTPTCCCYLILMKLLVVRCILSASSSKSFTPSYKLRGLQKINSKMQLA